MLLYTWPEEVKKCAVLQQKTKKYPYKKKNLRVGHWSHTSHIYGDNQSTEAAHPCYM